MIFKTATGGLLSAVQGISSGPQSIDTTESGWPTGTKPVQSLDVPPYDKRAHWRMDRTAFEHVEGGPVV